MQQAGHQQRLHDLRNATRQVQVDGQVLAGRLEVAQHRGFLAHALEVVNRPLDAGRMRNCQEVQHGIGRAAHDHDHRDRIFDGFSGDEVARLDVFFDRFDQHLRRFPGRVHLLVMRIGHGAGVGWRNVQRLEGAGHVLAVYMPP